MCPASVNVSNDIIIPGLAGQSLLYSVQTFHFTFMQPCYFTPFCPSTRYVDLAFISVRKEGKGHSTRKGYVYTNVGRVALIF